MHSGFKYDTYFSEVIYYNILKISKIVEQLQQNQREVNDRKRYKSIFWQIVDSCSRVREHLLLFLIRNSLRG